MGSAVRHPSAASCVDRTAWTLAPRWTDALPGLAAAQGRTAEATAGRQRGCALARALAHRGGGARDSLGGVGRRERLSVRACGEHRDPHCLPAASLAPGAEVVDQLMRPRVGTAAICQGCQEGTQERDAPLLRAGEASGSR